MGDYTGDYEHFMRQVSCLSLEESTRIYLGIRSSMNASISLLREQLYSDASPAQHNAARRELAATLLQYFGLFGDDDFLEQSITLYRELLLSLEHSNDVAGHSDLLDGLGSALCSRFEQHCRPDDIEEAMQLHERSLYLRASIGASIYRCLHNLGVAFYARCRGSIEFNRKDDSACAIELLKEALDLCCSPDDEILTLCHLSWTFWGGRTKALQYSRKAFLMSSPGHPYHPLAGTILIDVIVCYHAGPGSISLGSWSVEETMMYRYIFKLVVSMNHPHAGVASRMAPALIRAADGRDSIDSILKDSRALDRRFSSEIIYPYYICHLELGRALKCAYSETGSFAYLDECISHGRKMVQQADSNPRLRALLFIHINLAQDLHLRYELTGSSQDVDEAILLLEQLVLGTSKPSSELHYKGTLGDLILARFLINNDYSDLQTGLDLHRQYLEIYKFTPEATSKVAHLGGAIEAFKLGYRHKRDVTNIQATLPLLRTALSALSLSDSAYADGSDALAVALRLLSEHTRDPSYVREALSVQTRALTLLPAKSRVRSEFLSCLALCRICLWQLTGAYEELHAAMQEFAEAVGDRTSSPRRRFRDALEWSRAAEHADARLRLLALRQVITLRSKAVAFAGTMQARLHTLRMAPGLCTEAALHALACGDSVLAIDLLEQSRSVFWGQALNGRRVPRQFDGALPRRFVEVSNALAASSGDYPLEQQKALFDELELLDSSARQTGLSLPSCPLALHTSTRGAGLIIILAATASSAAAIVISNSTSSTVRAISLPGVRLDILQKFVYTLRAHNERQRKSTDLPSMDLDLRKLVTLSPGGFSRISYDTVLCQLWSLVALPIIKALGLEVTEASDRPRVIWSPTGIMSLLPIHAAGIYTGTSPVCVSDYMISSYTPSLMALSEAYHNRPSTPLSAEDARILLAAVPDAPGHTLLPRTLEEVEVVRELLPAWATVLSEDVTADQFFTALESAAFLHLACHGKQDGKDVLNSGFVFHDDLLTISRLMELEIKDACFAFLSTCESAMGDRTLPDETMHLAAAMLFIGYRSVIGTLWSMHDADGPKVAEHVYRELLKNREEFDYDAVPRALDAAVRALREDGVHPSRWATWIHMGI